MTELHRPDAGAAWKPRVADPPLVNGTAYELKFLLSTPLADEVLARARGEMPPDPHAERGLGEDCYRVYSLYFDTPELAVYHRLGWHGRRKLRIRRYGEAPQLFLERKARKADRVRKRRVVIAEEDLPLLARGMCSPNWVGEWFSRRLATRRLEPRMLVGYHRIARVGMTSDGPARLTVDRQICCRSAEGLRVPSFSAGRWLLEGQSILEFKFVGFLPGLFKRLMYEFDLQPTAVSKYRLSVAAWGEQASVDGRSGMASEASLQGGRGAECA